MIIPVNKEDVFQAYLVLMNSILSKAKKLTDQEIEVLGKFMYIDSLYSHLKKEQRDIILFHKLTKEKIRININNGKISIPTFHNTISSLRKKGFMKENSLTTKCPKVIDGKLDVIFQLKIKDDAIQES